MTHLRRMMLEELQRRNYAPLTIKAYLRIIEEFARYFHRPTRSVRRTCVSIRPISSGSGSWSRGRSRGMWPRYASSLSKP